MKIYLKGMFVRFVGYLLGISHKLDQLAEEQRKKKAVESREGIPL